MIFLTLSGKFNLSIPVDYTQFSGLSFSHRVVAYQVFRQNSTQLIASTFKAAWEQHAPDTGLIFHGDEGLNRLHIGSDNCFMSAQWCNLSPIQTSLMTTLLRIILCTIKKEDLYRNAYTSEAACKCDLTSYIEFYTT